jgi:flavin-binding protein dodecin
VPPDAQALALDESLPAVALKLQTIRGWKRVNLPPRGGGKGRQVADQTYGITEIVGTSPDSIHQAIRNGVSRASQTVRNLDWFEVSTIRGYITNGEVAHFQVQMKVGFRIEGADD